MIEVKHEDAGTSSGVLLHGYGANEYDLQPLAQMLPAVQSWLLPQAPVPLGAFSYAWFPFSLQQELLDVDLSRIVDVDPPGLREAAEQLTQECAALPRPLVIAGFSQGSMVALELAQHLRPEALVLLSSSLIAAPRWREVFGVLRGIPVFQSHGRHDDVLPVENAEALAALLRKSGAELEFSIFDGGHSVPGEILVALNEWLDGFFCTTRGSAR